MVVEEGKRGGEEAGRKDISRKVGPGEPATRESGQELLENLFFNPKRYDLAKVGRYKVNRKLGLDQPIRQGTLTEEDIVSTIEYLVRLHAGEEELARADRTIVLETADIPPFGNRRLRPLAPPIQHQAPLAL